MWDIFVDTVFQFTPSEDFVAVLLKCIQEISQHLRIALAPPNNPHILMMRALLEMTMQLRLTQNYATVLALLQKVCSCLQYGGVGLYSTALGGWMCVMNHN